MKGIVLAGGSGTRLRPLTGVLSKQILPVYDKPMIYYPISTLMASGVREILIISTPDHLPLFKNLLGDGSQIGVEFKYEVQENPKGLAQALTIGEKFIGDSNCALILGDNIFHGPKLGMSLKQFSDPDGAVIFAYRVADPTSYGVIVLDSDGMPIRIDEKPAKPLSNLAVPGFYFFDNQAVDIAKSVVPSARGELEITSVINEYLKMKKLNVEILQRGTTWLDTGTIDALQAASEFVHVIEERQGLKIGCIEEISWRNGWISEGQMLERADSLSGSSYGDYLRMLVNE